jgi:hypothetical protein
VVVRVALLSESALGGGLESERNLAFGISGVLESAWARIDKGLSVIGVFKLHLRRAYLLLIICPHRVNCWVGVNAAELVRWVPMEDY